MNADIDFRVFGYGTLQPKKDITAYEATQIALLLAAISANPNGTYTEFVAQNKLERHFINVDRK
jgi:hypothetical protein